MLLTVNVPVREAPSISALDTPVIVYGTFVPSATFVVSNVIEKLCPSFTLVALDVKEYVGFCEPCSC